MEINRTFVADGRDIHKMFGVTTNYSLWIRKTLSKARVNSAEFIIFSRRVGGRGRPPLTCFMTEKALNAVISVCIKDKEESAKKWKT
jgi:phage anti-repressor protein